MLDGLLVNQLIEESKNLTGWDLITTKGSGLPGLDIEIISRHLMYELEAQLNSYDKEHVTSFIYRNASYFQIAQIGERGTNSTNHPLLLDTLDDFFKINEFVEEYGPSYTFGKQ
jgi:spore coat polysaccharide biosynthesis protein SpsF (cytidylyltransferase family)